MAFRFRKSIKIAPGIRVNLSKSGVSTSIGGRGATVNFSKRGTRVTTGIPGTGLSASQLYKSTPKAPQEPTTTTGNNGWRAVGWILLLIIAGIVLKDCSTSKTQNHQSIASAEIATPIEPMRQAYTPAMSPTGIAAPQTPQVEVRYVGPASLNVRSSPSGKVIESLKHGAAVEIHAEDGGWSRISAEGEPVKWISSAYLCKWRDCSDKPKWKPALAKPTTPAPVRRAAPAASSAYGCPCSSSNNCYGPRGGRYCITSGGNKRYR